MPKRKHKINEKAIAVSILIVALVFSFLLFSQITGFIEITGFAAYSAYPEEISQGETTLEMPAEPEQIPEILPGESASYQKQTDYGIMAVPSNATVLLNATDHPLNRTTANLTCYANASDADGDNITYNGFWYKNGMQQFYTWNISRSSNESADDQELG
ncbi:hypothetical protein KY317_02235, partial [Candidatus Woesearchaeota archaeon]|nr:hypothetical protein [Candidatus Woesearchaeota archaeon]